MIEIDTFSGTLACDFSALRHPHAPWYLRFLASMFIA